MIAKLKKMCIQVIPVFIFFFIIFSLVDFTRILVIYDKTGIFNYTFLVIFISALAMAKVVVLSDELPFIDIFRKKPLIYATLWKTLIYFLMSILVRLIERTISGSEGPLETANTELKRLEFWIAQMWLAVLLLTFVAYQELIAVIGKDKVKKLFFGR